MRPKSLIPALTLSAGLCPGALAGPGDILWSIDHQGYGGFECRPAVAPDGSLYWTFRGLHKLAPATGQTIWFREDHASPLISIGPDGTIYGTGSVNHGTPQEPFWHPTALALTPDNQVLWSWEYNPDYWYPIAGPTLGPDGNVYLISYGGYWAPGHLFSLTSGGQFRWELRGFSTGSGEEHLTFAGGNVMKTGSSDWIPGGPLTSGAGVVAANMESGAFAWGEPMAPGGDPVVSPLNGDFYVRVGLSQELRAFAPPHQHTWSHFVQWSPTGMNTRQVGPDGNIYISEGISRVHSLRPDGTLRWSRPSALPIDAVSYYTPSVSPDGAVILYPGSGYGETPGYITALRTSDGAQLWRITLGQVPGRNQTRCVGGITFSPDSAVAYIPAVSVCYCGPDGYEEHGHLFAVQVSTGAPPGGCYANCDGSTAQPVLNVLDFNCFLNRFSAGDGYANCDQSTTPPALNVLDFNCFLNRFTAGCP